MNLGPVVCNDPVKHVSILLTRERHEDGTRGPWYVGSLEAYKAAPFPTILTAIYLISTIGM